MKEEFNVKKVTFKIQNVVRKKWYLNCRYYSPVWKKIKCCKNKGDSLYPFKFLFIRSNWLLHIFLQSSRLDEYIWINFNDRNIYSLNTHYGAKCSSKLTAQVSPLFKGCDKKEFKGIHIQSLTDRLIKFR